MKHIAIVTGASSGMGKELIRQLAGSRECEFDEIWAIASRRVDEIMKLSIELEADYQGKSTKIIALQLDLINEEHRALLRDALKKESPNIKLLVNAAGIGFAGRFAELKQECVHDMQELNCVALTDITHMCIPYMAKKTRIIQFASAAAFTPQPEFAVYAATKAYVLSFSRALSRELRKSGITVTAVCPGPVNTEFIDKASNGKKQGLLKKIALAEPKGVVRKALKDAYRGKSMSVYGFFMKASLVLSKLLPHGFIMKFFG